MSSGSQASLYERRVLKTLTVTNWQGSMTEYVNGDVNSGRTNVIESFGANPFSNPNSLTWNLNPVQIDSNGSVITDLIVAGKERLENGILYVYAIGSTGRLYKIQVNNPATYNPDYDNPVLIATLAINAPTFTRGGFMTFYGATPKIYIGHDMGVTSINFDGTGEAFVGILGSWIQSVPRPIQEFIGVLYVGNGPNLASIDSTLTVTSYTKLAPGFPSNSQVRDIDVSPDGTYLEAVVSNLPFGDITNPLPDIVSTASSESYIFKWNGTDLGYTSFNTFPSFSLNANILFQNYQYTFGSDQYGSAIFNPLEKRLTEPEVQPAMPNAIASTGNLVSWIAPFYFNGNLFLLNNIFGSLDWEINLGYWTNFILNATGTETDINRVPCQIPVSNFGLGASTNGYPNGIFGTGKIYFSTLETSSLPTTKYKFYKWEPIATSAVSAVGTAIQGVYQTQTELLSKKVELKEIRIYSEPWAAGNSFMIDIIGSDNNPIAGASKTFVAAAPNSLGQAGDGECTIGEDFAWYTPQASPTYAIGLRVTNLGDVNHVINKVEIDYAAIGGK